MKWRAKSKLARAGRILADRYRLEAPLGRGAMGEIWRAEHLRLKSPVAIKFLDSAIADDPEMLNRFLREAQSAAAVRSPHVVQIFDCGVERGAPFISMELLQGETLEARLSARQRLTPAELDRIFREVSLAVDKAHEVGVVHRDLKPGNIFLAREGEVEITKVLDFGIAKVVSHTGTHTPGLTATGTLLGTPHYMSPEQARGSREVDFRSDLWSLAVIAFECLTGQQPFPGLALGELVVQICTEEPRVPSSLAAVPAGFDEWFRRGASKDPSARFASAREMADTLSTILAASAAHDTASGHAGPPGTPDTLHSVTIPLGRPAHGESASERRPAANVAPPSGSHAPPRPEQPRVPPPRPPLAAQALAWLRRVRGTVQAHGEPAPRLAQLRQGATRPLAPPRPRWFVPALTLLGAALLLVLGTTRLLWFGATRPEPVFAGERAAVAAPPARHEQLQAAATPAAAPPAAVTPAAVTPVTPAAALPTAASPQREAASHERDDRTPIALELDPAVPRAAIARAAAPSPQRTPKPKSPPAPSRPTPKVRPLAEAPAAQRVPSAAATSRTPSSKSSAVDPFSERL